MYTLRTIYPLVRGNSFAPYVFLYGDPSHISQLLHLRKLEAAQSHNSKFFSCTSLSLSAPPGALITFFKLLLSTTCAMTSQKPALTLMGNPGVGKSTILNGMAGVAHFPSGLSLGKGYTTTISYFETDRHLLCDTPGLADIAARQEAAQQLQRLLNRSIPIKIAFVVTLQNGRIRSDDSDTINTVLSAFPVISTDDSFGVIINQVTTEVRRLLTNSTGMDEIKQIKQKLLKTRHTSHWCIVSKDDSISDAPNKCLMTNELRAFLENLPVTKPKNTFVRNLQTSTLPHTIKPSTWTWVDSMVKIKVTDDAMLRWVDMDWNTSRVYTVQGPVAVALKYKWIWSNAELVITGKE